MKLEILNPNVSSLAQKFAPTVSSVAQVQSSTNVKLPALNIPLFVGNISEWSSFTELCEILITNNSNLNVTQKLI